MSISAANGIENCKLCVVYIFIDTKKIVIFISLYEIHLFSVCPALLNLPISLNVLLQLPLCTSSHLNSCRERVNSIYGVLSHLFQATSTHTNG